MDRPGQSIEHLTGARRHERRMVWLIALLLTLALVVRLGYVAATPGYRAINDAHNYDVHARSIASGQGYARIGAGPTGETAFRPPGYPYLLAGVYALSGVERATTSTRFQAGRIANALIGTAIVALIGVLSAQLFDRRVALAAMALGTVYLPLILVGGSLMSEPLFAALLLGALAAAIHHRLPHRDRSVHPHARRRGARGSLGCQRRAQAPSTPQRQRTGPRQIHITAAALSAGTAVER